MTQANLGKRRLPRLLKKITEQVNYQVSDIRMVMKTAFGFYSVLIACLLGFFGGVGEVEAEDVVYDWTKTIGGTGTDGDRSITTDQNGNVYVTGYFSSTVDFDPGAGTDIKTGADNSDAYLSKYDSSGNYQWTRTFGGTGYDSGYSITTDQNGNVYVTGYFSSTVDFDPGAGTDTRTSAGGYDAYLSKYDSSGNYQWTRTFGGTGSDSSYGVAIDPSSNIYITGYFNGTVDFDPGPGTDTMTSAGGNDVFLSKYDSSGNYQWTKTFGGTGSDTSSYIAITQSGNLYITGYFNGTVDFDPGPGMDTKGSVGLRDVFFSKYDSSGNYQWTKTFGGTGNDYSYALATDRSGNLYIAGYFNGTVDFDPGAGTDTRTSAGGNDVFLSKYDSSGNYQWTRTFGGTGSDSSYGVAIDPSSNIYIAGYFNGTVDFDPGAGTDTMTSAGGDDVFLSKYDSSGDYQWTMVIGGTESDGGFSITVDPSDNLYLAGWFSGTIDTDPRAGTDIKTSAGGVDAYFSKYVFDGIPPPAPVITSPTTNTFSSNTALSISGTAEANSSITIYMDGSNVGTTTADSSGAWSYPPISSWSDGTYSLTATATDAANNTSAASSAVTVTIDTGVPAAPVITAPSSGTSTNTSQPTMSGTAEANAIITVYRNGVSQGTTAANGSGVWSYTPASAWSDGTYSLTATATDAASNTSLFSSAVSVTIDTVAPSSSTPTVPAWGDRTDTLTPSFSGAGDAGQTVRVWIDNNLAGTATIDSSGHWIWTPSSDLSIGSHSIEFSVIDVAGNESARTGSRTFEIVDDYDNDGLTTVQEAAQGTDPHNPDSDSDGVNDGAEVQHGTNPLNADSDADGLSDGQEEAQGTDPLNADTDRDSSSDSEELANGTNPLDRGSVLPKREKTLCAEWNGFLGMWNVMEHVNTGTRKISIESTLHDLFGVAQVPVTFGLKSGYQYDLLVHGMTGFQANRYGLICSTATNGQPGDLDGRMVFYKPDVTTGGYQFAFAMPLGTGLKGTQYVPYNTFQPSLDTEDAGNLAANWIQLTNLGSTKRTGNLVFYNQAGTEIARQSVTLKAGARFDYSAHDIAGLKQVGLVEWIPAQNGTPFQLRNVRYYYRADGVTVPLGDDFDSAFQLEGIVGNGQLLTVPLDTTGSSAVLELANTLNEEVKAEVSIYAAAGGTALHNQTYKLKPHATYHLIADALLNGSQGIATVKGDKLASVIATAMQYGRTETLGIQTVYGIQASEALGTAMRGSYNTFLKQGCRLLMANPTSAEAIASVSLKRYDGTIVNLRQDLAVPAHGLTDYDLCSQDQENVYGVVTVQPQTPNTIFATVLRIGENEQYRFPTPVRE